MTSPNLPQTNQESTATSLKHLIDIYIHLHMCEGIEDPPPLYINLTTKTRFTQRLAFLSTLIAQGKGLSHVKSSELVEDLEEPEFSEEVPLQEPNPLVAPVGVKMNDVSEIVAEKQHDNEDRNRDLYRPSSALSDTEANNTQISDHCQNTKEVQRIDFHSEASKGFPEASRTNGSTEGHHSSAEDDSEIVDNPARSSLSGSARASPGSPHSSVVDDGDSVEYEEDEELDIESTTLPSAVHEPASPSANGFHQVATHNSPSDTDKVQDNIAQIGTSTDVATAARSNSEPERDDIPPTWTEEGKKINSRTSVSSFKESYDTNESEPQGTEPHVVLRQTLNAEEHAIAEDLNASSTVIFEENALAAFAVDGVASANDGDNQVNDHSLNHHGVPSVSDITDQSDVKPSGTDDNTAIAIAQAELDASHSINREETQPVLSEKPGLTKDNEENPDQKFEDEDEITFEDEEVDEDNLEQPPQCEPIVNISPASSKRRRDLYEDDGTEEHSDQGMVTSSSQTCITATNFSKMPNDSVLD